MAKQQTTRHSGAYNIVVVDFHDGEERPYDQITLRNRSDSIRTLTREDGESVSELEQRAFSAPGLDGQCLLRIHVVAKNSRTGTWFTPADYEAVGGSPR